MEQLSPIFSTIEAAEEYIDSLPPPREQYQIRPLDIMKADLVIVKLETDPNEAFCNGWKAYFEGVGAMACPYDKMTREWNEWQRPSCFPNIY